MLKAHYTSLCKIFAGYSYKNMESYKKYLKSLLRKMTTNLIFSKLQKLKKHVSFKLKKSKNMNFFRLKKLKKDEFKFL